MNPCWTSGGIDTKPAARATSALAGSSDSTASAQKQSFVSAFKQDNSNLADLSQESVVETEQHRLGAACDYATFLETAHRVAKLGCATCGSGGKKKKDAECRECGAVDQRMMLGNHEWDDIDDMMGDDPDPDDEVQGVPVDGVHDIMNGDNVWAAVEAKASAKLVQSAAVVGPNVLSAVQAKASAKLAQSAAVVGPSVLSAVQAKTADKLAMKLQMKEKAKLGAAAPAPVQAAVKPVITASSVVAPMPPAAVVAAPVQAAAPDPRFTHQNNCCTDGKCKAVIHAKLTALLEGNLTPEAQLTLAEKDLVFETAHHEYLETGAHAHTWNTYRDNLETSLRTGAVLRSAPLKVHPMLLGAVAHLPVTERVQILSATGEKWRADHANTTSWYQYTAEAAKEIDRARLGNGDSSNTMGKVENIFGALSNTLSEVTTAVGQTLKASTQIFSAIASVGKLFNVVKESVGTSAKEEVLYVQLVENVKKLNKNDEATNADLKLVEAYIDAIKADAVADRALATATTKLKVELDAVKTRLDKNDEAGAKLAEAHVKEFTESKAAYEAKSKATEDKKQEAARAASDAIANLKKLLSDQQKADAEAKANDAKKEAEQKIDNDAASAAAMNTMAPMPSATSSLVDTERAAQAVHTAASERAVPRDVCSMRFRHSAF